MGVIYALKMSADWLKFPELLIKMNTARQLCTETLPTHLDESWNYHFQLGLANLFLQCGTHQNFQKYLLDS